jgi:hypothetical protein
MRLWTWQNPCFSLANKQQEVKSIEYSIYLNHDCIPEKEKNRHKASYQKVWERLGTNQILWCFTQYEDAVDNASVEEFEKIGCLLWELDAPGDKIIKYCNTAWECLRFGKPRLPFDVKEFAPDKWDKIVKDFDEYWKGKSDQQLLETMFLKKLVNGCSDAIVFHPVEQYSIRVEKNPKKENKWWCNNVQKRLPYKSRSSEVKEIMPCAQCPGAIHLCR